MKSESKMKIWALIQPAKISYFSGKKTNYLKPDTSLWRESFPV